MDPNIQRYQDITTPQVRVAPRPALNTPVTIVPPPMNDAAASLDSALDEIPLDRPEEEPPPPPKKRLSRQRIIGVALLVCGCLMALLLGMRLEANRTKAQNANLLSPSARFQQQQLSLNSLSQQLHTIPDAANGRLTVNGSVVLTPSLKPSNATTGQLYYDQATNRPLYYDGTGFVPLQGGSVVTNNTTNNTFNNTTVGGNSISGTPGALAMFGPDGSILADSHITQSGSTLNVATTGGGSVNIGSGSGGAVTIASAAASSFTTTTGSLTLGAGGGTGGGVLVRPQADAISAFTVQDASGARSLFNVDTLGDAVTLGVGSVASFGNTSVGSIGGCCNVGKLQASKFTTIGGGTISSISAFVGWGGTEPAPNNQFQLAIYADNGSGTAPGAYIASTAVSTLSPTTIGTGGVWNTLPITASLSAGTTYWLAFWNNTVLNDSNNALSLSSPSNGAIYQSSATWGSGTNNGMPATFPAGARTPNFSFSMYASFSTAGPALILGAGGLVTASGPVLFQDPTNSSTAFQVQDNVGNAILLTDTSNSIVTVTTLAVTRHIVTSGTAPGIAAGPAACTTPTISLTGNDTAGVITVTTGTGCAAAGRLASVTFTNAFGSAPHVLVSPVTATAEGRGYVDVATVSTTAFDLDVGTAPASTTTYKWNYLVVQ